MSKITLSQIVNPTNLTTVATTINNNSSTLQTAFDNTLSRDGTSPNQMISNLDMNSFHILNLPEPSSDNDPIRKIDLTNVSTITNLIHTASSTSVTIGTGNQTFIVPSGLGFQVGQYILIQQNGNTANYMSGRVVSYSLQTLVVNVTTIGGSGTISNWTIDVSGAPGATGSQGPQGLPGTPVNVYDTRTIAITASIPNTTNMIRTLAYDSSYTPESGATFTRVPAGTPFIDSQPTAGTIVGGASYTNGTYFGVPLGGSPTGIGLVATVTVSGNAVTSVSYATQPGNGYKVGDVLTAPVSSIGGTGSGFTYTITAVSTPFASFTNTIDGSLWQYVPDKGCTHVNQFGAKPNWSGSDASAANNFYNIQAALFFGARNNSFAEGGGGNFGDKVLCGQGTYMIFSSPAASLIVPFGVYLEGVSGTTIKLSDSFDPNTHGIILGDPNSHLACFRSGLRNLTLFFKRGIAVSGLVYMVYSNNTQDGGGLDHVYMYSGQRGCFHYEIGYGGASSISLNECSFNWEGTNDAFLCNVGTTVINVRNLVTGAPSSGTNNTVNAVNLQGTGGMYHFDGFHAEESPNGFSVNLTGSAYVTIKNASGGNGLAQLVTLVSGNTPGNLSLEQCAKNGSTVLVVNGQPGGLGRTADVQPKDGIVFFNP